MSKSNRGTIPLVESRQQLLDNLVQSTDARHCMALARDLVECGDASTAEQLLPLVAEERGAVSEAAAFLLAEWSIHGHVPAAHVPAIVKGLAHASPEVRQWCAACLRGLGPDAGDAVGPLIDALHDSDNGVRQAAVDALGQIAPDDESLLLRLVDLLSDEEPVRNAVIRVLAGLEGGHEAVFRKIAASFRDPAPELRAGAAAAAGKLLRIRPDFVARLVDCLNDFHANVRMEAARSLSEIPEPPRSVVLGLGKALRDPVSAVRQEAARALDILGSASACAVPYLLAVLTDPDSTVRFHAVEALEKLAPRQADMLPAVVLALGNRLIDADSGVQTRALTAFSKLAPYAFPLNPHLHRALQSPDTEIRLAAVEALAHIRHEGLRVRDILRSALSDPDGSVRVAAALALAKRQERGIDVVSTLVSALREPGARVQVSAIRALRTLGPDAACALTALEAKREDSNPDIRHLAELAIRSIAGHALTESDA